jgi:hypothetical protein
MLSEEGDGPFDSSVSFLWLGDGTPEEEQHLQNQE